ncbi:MAG: aminotransferase class V-fold PLP-dependent enzyme, partial [Candidatus Acidiferrales bacterium]
MTDWRKEWFEIEDAVYLNAAGQGPLPRAAVRAAQQALEWKKFPHRIPESEYFELPGRVRTSLARLIGAQPEEIALATGASGGIQIAATRLELRPGNEVLIARGEFPAHFATWLPMQSAAGITVKVVAPRGRFLNADDFLEHITPRTRLISASLVRFNDAARLDARRVADAVHAAGGLLLLDASQCAGAMPLTADSLACDFLTAAGYKWLLSPYGTGFLWIRSGVMKQLREGPVYWQSLEDAGNFHSLPSGSYAHSESALRWDSPETASFFNLAAMEASLEFIHRTGVETIWRHIRGLIDELVRRLPLDRCVLASPAEPDARGPFVCVQPRKLDGGPALY